MTSFYRLNNFNSNSSVESKFTYNYYEKNEGIDGRFKASRTVGRETSNCSANSASEGKRSFTFNWPPIIASRMAFAIWAE